MRSGSLDGSGSSDDGAPVTIPRVPAREAAEDELSKPMYHENDPSLLRRLLDWVWERIGDLLDTAAGATPGGRVGLAAVALLVVLLLAGLRLRMGALRRAPGSARFGELFDDRPRSADEHRAAAERYASAARWSEALQERMRALVRSLEERALLDPRPGRTADEAASEAARVLPDHTTALYAAALAFDEVTYAGRPADQAAYLRLRDLEEAVRRSRPHLTGDPTPAAPGGGAV
ncbi:DUF4129 domain-containing protein [Streptomyces verrucosisporus]|uniref:DUF4129 domain-containing protein n=1 Tax=Streptomyces verrucosisporus TaxID=1695161 RepID=UPI0019D060AA|nr:DUF4129 domain-containing protein [Streptomyces verrucosisporus]MBN3930240.1 DUF4129 domain-containing protein [Streptomyces verrucosisporus]